MTDSEDRVDPLLCVFQREREGERESGLDKPSLALFEQDRIEELMHFNILPPRQAGRSEHKAIGGKSFSVMRIVSTDGSEGTEAAAIYLTLQC